MELKPLNPMNFPAILNLPPAVFPRRYILLPATSQLQFITRVCFEASQYTGGIETGCQAANGNTSILMHHIFVTLELLPTRRTRLHLHALISITRERGT